MGMTTNEAIEILRKNRPTSDTRPCGMELCDAVDMAISALRQQETVTNRNGLNEPLTLDELRKMDGEPVYCVEITGREEWLFRRDSGFADMYGEFTSDDSCRGITTENSGGVTARSRRRGRDE